jgi:hypothetical protein
MYSEIRDNINMMANKPHTDDKLCALTNYFKQSKTESKQSNNKN